MTTPPFGQWRGVAAPMLRSNIDTEVIIPSREMKLVSKLGLGEGLFAGERYLNAQTREDNPDFVLNRPAFQGCSILIAGSNFGCGSSREHAVWALREFGIRVILATSFGAIFANNCVRNGLLAISLSESLIKDIADWVLVSPQEHQPEIDLASQRIEFNGTSVDFAIEGAARHMLLHGLDAIALTLTRWEAIEAFDKARQNNRPWLYV